MKRRKDRYNTSIPEPVDVLVVIEVSNTTYDEGIRMDSVDRNLKLPLYASAGIPVYWIVNLQADRIEAYSDPESDKYKDQITYNPGDKIYLLDKMFGVSEILILS